MQIRESLNNNPVFTVALTIVVIGASAWFVSRYGCSHGPKPPPPVTQYYFSTDDGKTFFADDRLKVPPYKREDGQEAVRAHVFNCEHDKTKFVGYLERYTEAAKAKIEAADAQKRGMIEDFESDGKEVKRPGEGNRWVGPRREQEYNRVQDIKDPHDATKYAREVMPGLE